MTPALVCAVGVVAQVWGERAGVAWGRRLGKPAASGAFLAQAASVGVDASAWWALALCFVGDLALLGVDRRAVAVGLLAFLLGHVGWLAVLLDGAPGYPVAVAGAALTGPAWLAWRIVAPHTGRLRPAVAVYLVVVTAMAAAALARLRADPTVALSGVAFWLSDGAVARQRFLTSDWRNRAVGLPLYYAAMFGLIAFAAKS